MKVVFMGTPDFAVNILEEIIEAGHEVAAVVTQPDKPKGRGKNMQFPPVKECAQKHRLPVYQPVKIREPECVEQLRSFEADLFVVAAFGQILPKEILEMPEYGCINVHASLLPKYRGAAPIQRVIMDGEKESGVTIMKMDIGLDTGDMILKTVVPIEEKETGGSYHDKLSAAGAELCIEAMKLIEAGTAVYEKQEEEQSCYAKMLNKQTGKIDWGKSAVQIERLIRGLNPWPSAYSILNGRTCKIWAADAKETEAAGECGEIISIGKSSFTVKTGTGVLVIKELQMEGKKRMSAEAFLRGTILETGTVFS